MFACRNICAYFCDMNTITDRQIWPEHIQPIENLCFEHVESSYMKVVAIRIAVVYIILMGCALLLPLLWDNRWLLAGVECAVAVAFAVNVALARKIYDFKGYALRERDISYRSGIFFPTVTTIPFSKIQQVSMRMNLASRIFGLYYVDVINGSQSAMNQLTIPGLTHDKAERLKSLLVNKADCDND